jgi:hypothetical protein
MGLPGSAFAAKIVGDLIAGDAEQPGGEGSRVITETGNQQFL